MMNDAFPTSKIMVLRGPHARGRPGRESMNSEVSWLSSPVIHPLFSNPVLVYKVMNESVMMFRGKWREKKHVVSWKSDRIHMLMLSDCCQEALNAQEL